MADFRFDTQAFDRLSRNLIDLYGQTKVNNWVKTSLGGRTPVPLRNALKRVTPRRTGRLRRTVGHQVLRQHTGEREPVLFVGGRLAQGGFIYHFLRGTRQRQTKKGQNRGSIRNLRLDERATQEGKQQTLIRFGIRFRAVFQEAVGKLARKVNSRRSRTPF